MRSLLTKLSTRKCRSARCQRVSGYHSHHLTPIGWLRYL